MGLAYRKRVNKALHKRGEEPHPNPVYHGIKRMTRFLKRHGASPVVVKNPSDYVTGYQRRRQANDQTAI